MARRSIRCGRRVHLRRNWKVDFRGLIRAAFAQIDEHGLDAFSMKALGKRLGVSSSAMYWHVVSKNELLSLMASRLYQRAFSEASHSSEWRGWLLAYGRSLRRAMLNHRDSARLCARADLLELSQEDVREQLASPLEAAGLNRQTALTYIGSVTALAVGWTSYEQANVLTGHLHQLVNFEAGFLSSLSAMVFGFSDCLESNIGQSQTARTDISERNTRFIAKERAM